MQIDDCKQSKVIVTKESKMSLLHLMINGSIKTLYASDKPSLFSLFCCRFM